MKWTRQIIIILSLLVFPATAFAAGQDEEEPLDVKTMLFEHIGDSYQWHITRIGDKDISVPLPVIVKSSTGWHCFLSSRLEEGPYEGLYLAEGGKYDGKIVEKDASGNEVRPFDISVTKNVLGLMINSLILVILVLGCSRWYRKHDVLKEAPTGVASLMEPVIEMINDDVIKGSIPGKLGDLALFTFLAVNLFANRHYWKDIFWPDVPWWLKVPVPLIPFTEFIGIFTKPFALMIRLFANILAGHAIILSFVFIIFITVKMGPLVNGTMTVVSVLFGVFMDCIELLVAFIQAYVFTMLSAVFIGLAHEEPEAGKE